MKKIIGIVLVVMGLIIMFGLGMNYGFFMRNRQKTIPIDTMVEALYLPQEHVYSRYILRSCIIKLGSLEGSEK